MKIEESITNSVDLENRSPQSTRLFTKIAIISALIALILFFVSAITYQIDNKLGLSVFASVIIPIIVLFVGSLYLAICERLRAKYMSAIVALILTALIAACLIAFVTFELMTYGEIFIAPFNPPPAIK